MQLTKEQKHAIKELLKFKNQVATLGGYGGTGKTTVVSHICQALPNFAVCAYTGKASHVLRNKGIENASTIHSLIYEPRKDQDGDVYFALAELLPCEGIIVDEASMVSKEIYNDLLSFKKPIIFVGDHGQLPPIGDSFNLMEKPDFTLEEIHRNAGEIAFFAEHIRKGFKPSSWQFKSNGNKVKFIDKRNYEQYLTKVDQIIVPFNKLRARINNIVREQLGLPPYPVPGDRIMCLRNNHKLGVFNGMQGKIVELYGKSRMLFEADGVGYDLKYDPDVFGMEKYEFEYEKDGPIPFDWCYGTTCHKCQGSEYEKTLVVEQKCTLWDQIRWSYTGASRAKEEIYWVPA